MAPILASRSSCDGCRCAAGAEALLEQAGTSARPSRSLYLGSLGAAVGGTVLGIVLRLGPAALLVGSVAGARCRSSISGSPPSVGAASCPSSSRMRST